MATQSGDLNRKSGWVCPYSKCDGNGFVYDEEKNIATDCPCRPQLIAYTRATSLRARIPDRFRHVSFDSPPISDMTPAIVRKVKRFVTNLDANLSEGHGLWFEGNAGTGKTSLATVVSLAAREAGRSYAIYSVPRVLNELRRTFDDDSTVGNLELIDRLTAVELLQLDDLGSERTNPWVLEQLYALIDARYEAQRSVIVTTNLGREALIEQVGERVVSRLSEMCELILLYGEDHRKKSDEWATSDQPPTSGPASASWHSPAGAANLERPAWTDTAASAEPQAPQGVPAGPSPPSWWDRRDPWPPAPGDPRHS